MSNIVNYHTRKINKLTERVNEVQCVDIPLIEDSTYTGNQISTDTGFAFGAPFTGVVTRNTVSGGYPGWAIDHSHRNNLIVYSWCISTTWYKQVNIINNFNLYNF